MHGAHVFVAREPRGKRLENLRGPIKVMNPETSTSHGTSTT
jgi:hypothetical protein